MDAFSVWYLSGICLPCLTGSIPPPSHWGWSSLLHLSAGMTQLFSSIVSQSWILLVVSNLHPWMFFRQWWQLYHSARPPASSCSWRSLFPIPICLWLSPESPTWPTNCGSTGQRRFCRLVVPACKLQLYVLVLPACKTEEQLLCHWLKTCSGRSWYCKAWIGLGHESATILYSCTQFDNLSTIKKNALFHFCAHVFWRCSCYSFTSHWFPGYFVRTAIFLPQGESKQLLL